MTSKNYCVVAGYSYVYNPLFDLPAREIPIEVRNVHALNNATNFSGIRWETLSDGADEERLLKRKRVLSAEEERLLFLGFNYARYLRAKYHEEHNGNGSLRERKGLDERVAFIERPLIEANLALVRSEAKKIKIPSIEFDELVSEGNIALMNCVNKFDVSLGFKFSTYAVNGIQRKFYRQAHLVQKRNQHETLGYEPNLENVDLGDRRHVERWEDSVGLIEEIIAKNLASLTEYERVIVLERFGIATREEGRTLKEIGKVIGMTPERVRQIQNNAYRKIRSFLTKRY